jgi:porphobilinogen synthase
MVAETQLSVKDLIYPVFVQEGKNQKTAIESMPGQNRFTVDLLPKEIEAASDLKIPAILLFGLTSAKDEQGTASSKPDGVVQQAIQTIKKSNSDLVVMTDVCLCAYTTHGHCGVIKDGRIDHEMTAALLGKMAVSQAQAGADVVAPSAMMDGQVAAIREALDQSGFKEVAIMSYSAKYASAFYGPFREASDSAPQFGDRKSYQMNPANVKEALREIRSDIEQGADIVMVKPGLAYLDVVRKAREMTHLPLAVYNVSGEYSMIKAAAQKGWIDEKEVVLETMLAFKRAGADLIITYYAKEVAGWQKDS